MYNTQLKFIKLKVLRREVEKKIVFFSPQGCLHAGITRVGGSHDPQPSFPPFHVAAGRCLRPCGRLWQEQREHLDRRGDRRRLIRRRGESDR